MKKIGILMVTVLALTGCVQQTELTDQESEKIAAYAAYVTLQHDKNYNKRLVEVTSETTEQTDENIMEAEQMDVALTTDNANVSTDNANVSSDEIVEGETESTEPESIASTLKLEGFNVTYEGFDYATQYSDPTQTDGYVANSLENSEFVVLNFKVENTTDETKLCDILSLSPRLNVSINGEEAIKTYATLLNNDMSTLFNEIGAHETLDVVLLVEVPEEYDNNVSSISLDIVVNGQESTFEFN